MLDALEDLVHGRQEPADPPQMDAEARRQTRLAPQYDADKLQGPFTECGCGECGDHHGPLSGVAALGDIEEPCQEPQAVTVEKAAEIYKHYEGSAYNSDDRRPKYSRHTALYGKILEADRRYQREYDGLTTAMLTRRLSPVTDDGRWMHPLHITEMLHDSKVRQSVRGSIRYQLGQFDWEYVAVTAPTESAATPHEHLFLWIDDPDDEIDAGVFESALEKHLEGCENAYKKHHEYRQDGTDGAITVQNDPTVVDGIPEKASAVLDSTETADEEGRVPMNTAGAVYVASQLAHLPFGDLIRHDRQNPPRTLVEGAAIAWATPSQWFTRSQSC